MSEGGSAKALRGDKIYWDLDVFTGVNTLTTYLTQWYVGGKKSY